MNNLKIGNTEFPYARISRDLSAFCSDLSLRGSLNVSTKHSKRFYKDSPGITFNDGFIGIYLDSSKGKRK